MLRGYLARRRSSRRRAAVRVVQCALRRWCQSQVATRRQMAAQVVQRVARHDGSDGTHVPVEARGSVGTEARKGTRRQVWVRSPAGKRRETRRKRAQRRRKQRARRAMSRGEGQQVLQNEARSLGSVQSSSEVQALSGADGVSAASAVGSVECSRMDRLQNRNYQSRQSAEPNASLQVGGAECQAAQVALASERASTVSVSVALAAPQSVGSATADGSLVTFVVPEVPSGSLLRLRLDGGRRGAERSDAPLRGTVAGSPLSPWVVLGQRHAPSSQQLEPATSGPES
jgi:hypothetical protein